MRLVKGNMGYLSPDGLTTPVTVQRLSYPCLCPHSEMIYVFEFYFDKWDVPVILKFEAVIIKLFGTVQVK